MLAELWSNKESYTTDGSENWYNHFQKLLGNFDKQ